MRAFGATDAEAVAATLIYRLLNDVPTLVLGLIAAATFKLHRSDHKGTEAAAVHEAR